MLSEIQAPETPVNFQALTLWAQSEGMPATANNWLATSLRGPGSRTPTPPYSEPFYTSVITGARATSDTLVGGGYGGVVAALQQGTSLRDIYLAINASPWCAGCSTGRYPIALYQAVAATVPATPVTITPPPPAPTSIIVVQNGTMNAWSQELAAWVEVLSVEVMADVIAAIQIVDSL